MQIISSSEGRVQDRFQAGHRERYTVVDAAGVQHAFYCRFARPLNWFLVRTFKTLVAIALMDLCLQRSDNKRCAFG